MALQGVQVDGVSDVLGQELVALVLESLAVLRQLGQLLGAGGEIGVHVLSRPAADIAGVIPSAPRRRRRRLSRFWAASYRLQAAAGGFLAVAGHPLVLFAG